MKLYTIALLLLASCGHHSQFWVVIGPNPPVTEEWKARAIELSEIVREVTNAPVTYGGTIDVKLSPFRCAGTLDKWCAGQSYGNYIRVLFTPKPEDGALIHELCHEVYCCLENGLQCSEAVANACAAKVKAVL